MSEDKSSPANASLSGSTTPKTIGMISLGCPKALVDSERILTQLKTDGYQLVNSYENADMVIVNTCGFIDSAKQESFDAIGEAIAENGKVIVTGCMGANANDITAAHPKVLSVTGPHAYEEVVSAVHQYVPIETHYNPHIDLVPPQGIKLTPRHYAYLKISEGCNHRCSFCIIPSMRGDLVSRGIGSVMDEAERLTKAGVKELLVISQDTSAYGVDLKYKTDFWQGRPLKTRMQSLCEALGELGIWVRLHYVYPYPHVDKVIPLMAEGKILPYLDIPFQHASLEVLKAMKRPAATENTLRRIEQWRSSCPDITLRSTFIVGFPGETDDDFEQLLAFLKEAQLDRVGCFEYSAVAGASANQLPNPVADEVKKERWHRFMETQQAISSARLQAKIGSKQRVIIDGIDEASDRLITRTTADAPEIDGIALIDAEGDFALGDFIDVEITDADEYDLYGRQIP